jgi:predicted ATPase
LERAVATYCGDLLPGHYDDWVLHERERLAHRFLEALEQLILLREQRRDYDGAIGCARRLLQHDPLHEPAYRQLMRLHALNGERAAALRVYHTCVTVLKRELGVPPGGETREIYQGLLDLERGALPVLVSSRDSHFVGRQKEWQTLQDRWRLVRRGGVHCVCISGEPGIGKTRLAEEMIRWARQQGIPAAVARAYAEGGDRAYAPLVALLRSDSLRSRVSRMEPVWRSELARLLPELLAEDPTLPRPEPLAEHWQVQRLYDAVGRVLLAPDAVRGPAPGRPLILLLEDVQWFDCETVAWLRYFLRTEQPADAQSRPAQRLLVMGVLRAEELEEGHPLMHLLLDLRRGDRLTELELQALSAAESAELAARVAGRPLDAAEADAIHRATEGNPLFIVETVRAAGLATTGNGSAPALTLAPKVQAAIQARLAQLSPAARDLAELAAAAGSSFSYDVLALASGQDENTLVRSLDELWRRRIVRERGAHDYDFSHDRIRDVAYAEMSQARRSLVHRHTAQALESLHASDLDSVSGLIAAHYERAGMAPQAVSYYRLAAAVAQQLYANQDALNYSERGLALLSQ